MWNPGSIAQIIRNERHCGDVLARKTFTPSFLDHKAKKNVDERTKYRKRDHHEPIVSREVFNAATLINACRGYAKKNRPLPVLSVVDDGVLRGYVPVDKDWTGFSVEEYQAATESVYDEDRAVKSMMMQYSIDRSGYIVLQEQLFSTRQNPALTINNGKMRFNSGCLKKFKGVEWVELLLNTVDKCIAIRPCDQSNPNAIHWGRLRDTRWIMSSVSCRGLARTLFDFMNWESNTSYRLRGRYITNGDSFCMVFGMENPEMVRVEDYEVPPVNPEECEKSIINSDDGKQIEVHVSQDERGPLTARIVVRRKLRVLPPNWENSYGQPYINVGRVGIMEQLHFAGNWDVLRPAKEIEEYNAFNEESLAQMMREAEKIMEGWE